VKTRPYRDYNSYLRELFQCRVQKITLDAGFSCPNRDGSRGVGDASTATRGVPGPAWRAWDKASPGSWKPAKPIWETLQGQQISGLFSILFQHLWTAAELKQVYEEALAVPDVVGLAIGTRPDCVPDEVLDTLAELNQKPSHLG